MTQFSHAASLASEALKRQELFPIREVSRLTGVNPVTLRAWERRYGLIEPTRTDSGHRLYSQADIDRVHSILGWLERGVAVSKVGTVLARGESVPKSVVAERAAVGGEWAEWQARVRRAVATFDEQGLERLYGLLFSGYPLAALFQEVLMPVWEELLVHQGEFGKTSEWLFFDGFLRGRALLRLQLTRSDDAARVLLVAVPGHCRELELLVAGVLLGGPDVSISLPGFGVPLNELLLIGEKLQPNAVVVLSHQPRDAGLPRQLSKLALMLDCPLLLAGAAADFAEAQLAGTPIGCLGSEGREMHKRLLRFLDERLDT